MYDVNIKIKSTMPKGCATIVIICMVEPRGLRNVNIQINSAMQKVCVRVVIRNSIPWVKSSHLRTKINDYKTSVFSFKISFIFIFIFDSVFFNIKEFTIWLPAI